MTSYKETCNLPGILEISSLLQNQKVHYHVHNSPLLVAILCHGDQDHIILQYCFKVKVMVRVKVKFTLEQATKAQRGSRGIALLFP
jgi:hypothetical protein